MIAESLGDSANVTSSIRCSSCEVEKLSQLPFFFIAERCWNDIDTV